MPELPEVETTTNKIKPCVKDNKIVCMVVRQTRLRWPVAKEIIALQQQKVLTLFRRGKYIIFKLDDGYLVVHLGMTGFLKIVEEYTPLEKHDHIDVMLADGKILRYNDVRRFGAWLWFERLEECVLLQKLGVEPLSDNFNLSYLIRCFQHKQVACKIAIMDAKIVVGVGNIYASEALFLAHIHPVLPTNTLNKRQINTLVVAIKNILTNAVLSGGTTIRNFQQPDGKIGYFVQRLNVYGRKGKECYVCRTLIESKIIGQRNSFFCPKCQRKSK